MKIIIHVFLNSLAVFVSANILPGVRLDGFKTALVVAVVLGLVNAVLRPILLVLTIPINIMSLGLFTFVIIGGLVELVSFLVPGFQVASFWWALAFALVLWLVNAFLHSFERD